MIYLIENKNYFIEVIVIFIVITFSVYVESKGKEYETRNLCRLVE
jgi:hypothetical protein